MYIHIKQSSVSAHAKMVDANFIPHRCPNWSFWGHVESMMSQNTTCLNW